MEAQQPVVVVVSNRESCRKLYYHNLKKRGWPVLEARGPGECLLYATMRPITAIILCRLVEAIDDDIEPFRRAPELAAIPLILISLYVPHSEWIKHWHIVSHMVHPASIPQLIHCLNLLQHSSMHPVPDHLCDFSSAASASSG